MDLRALGGVISALLYLFATVPYIRAALRRVVRPNLITWGGGVVVNGIAFTAQMAKEPSWSATIAGVTTCYSLVIVVLTWRNGDRALERFDIVCLSIGTIAIIAWQLSGVAEVALILSVVADVVLCAPMVLKTGRSPSSEIPAPFLIGAIAAALSASSAIHYDAVNLTWPIWEFTINGLIGLLALRSDSELLGAGRHPDGGPAI